jgi:signal transduction histidine kinase
LAFFEFLVRYRYVLDQDTVTYYTQRVRDTLEGAELTSGAHLTFQRLNERETALRPNDAAIRSRSASTSSTRANVAYPLPTHVEKAVKDILATNGPWSGRGIAVVDTAGQPIFSSATLVPKDAAAATELILPHGWRVLAFPQSGSIATLVARDANRYALWMVLVFGTVVAALVLAARSVARELMLARLRAEFVAGVSHELKTPLSLIRMFGESLREGWVAESKKQDYYEVITRESERLTGLINNVLDFSRLESGTRGYAFDAVDLRPLVQDILNRYEFHLRAANIDLVRDLPDMPFSARADRDAVEQVIVNLLSNAVKYMGEPDRQPREIRVSLSREGRAAVLRVGDTGIGISEENRRYIFDRFYRSDDERVRAVTGSGLGLTLVKAHVDAHAGMIVVDSVPNQGSTFSIFLPLAEAVPA